MDPEKSLDNLANGGDEVVELVTPDGLRIQMRRSEGPISA